MQGPFKRTINKASDLRAQKQSGKNSAQSTITEALHEAFVQAGFKPLDNRLMDDGGKEVQNECILRARSTSDVQRIVTIAHSMSFGVMPIGSLTSAIGAFETRSAARLHGLNGFVGIQIQPSGQLEPQNAPPSEFERLIPSDPDLRENMEVFRSVNSEASHQVRVWAGLTPGRINEALIDLLGPGHSVYLDLTTFNQAQIGAVVANGSEGPVRANARFNLVSATLVDGAGQLHQLTHEQAKAQVGQGGTAGILSEITLEVIFEGSNEFGFFMPLPGRIGKEYTGMVNHLPHVMATLDPFSQAHFIQDSKGKKLVAKRGPILLKGFEIITRSELRSTYGSLREDSEERGRIGSLLENMRDSHCHVGLMINCTTDITEEEMLTYLEALYEDRQDADNLFCVIRNLQREQEVYQSKEGLYETEEDIVYFRPSEIKALKRMREAIPEMTRASKLRGFTSSTDVNCRLTSESEQERERAYKAIMETYWMYINDLRDRDFRVYIYGHLHPGDREQATGGGIDLHVRGSYFLEGEDEDRQKRAPEAWVYLKDRKKQLLNELHGLHGQFGICIEAGEKRISSDYARWLSNIEPEAAEAFYRTNELYGAPTLAARSPIKLHAHPPRIKEGILNLFAPDPNIDERASLLIRLQQSILLWCQHSHRSPESARVIAETHGLLRDWLALDSEARIFFTESPEKALHTSLMGLVNFRKDGTFVDLRTQRWEELTYETKQHCQVVICDSPAQLVNPDFKDCHTILISENAEPICKADLDRASIAILSAQAIGAGAELGIIVTSRNVIQHARMIALRNNPGYAHALVELDDRPHETIETPRLPVIAELGCLLAEKLGQSCNLSHEQATEMLEWQNKLITFNPGPSQINRKIVEKAVALHKQTLLLHSDTEARIKAIAGVERQLRDYFSIPNNHHIFFTGSATQAMEQIVESLPLDYAVVGVKGAFGERMATVARRYGQGIMKSVHLRWGEGENSQVKSIASEMFSKLPANPRKRKQSRVGFFITAHETSTAVQTQQKPFLAELQFLAQKNGLKHRPFCIVDGTSELGFTKPDFQDIDVYFGSVQKFLGCPAGLGVMIVSDRALRYSIEQQKAQQNIKCMQGYRCFPQLQQQREQGFISNLRGVLELGVALADYQQRGGIRTLQKETQKKLSILMDAVSNTTHLAPVIVSHKDRSGVMAHLVGVDIEVSRIVERLADHAIIGNGYGPYKGETLRLYCSPNLSLKQVHSTTRLLDRALSEMESDDEILTVKPPRKSRNLDKEWLRAQGQISVDSLRSLLPERLLWRIRRELGRFSRS